MSVKDFDDLNNLAEEIENLGFERESIEKQCFNNPLLKRYIEVIKAIETKTVQRDKLMKSDNIKNFMEETNVDHLEGSRYAVSLTKSYMKKTLDTTRLKEEKPEVYTEYLKETPVKSSIKVKLVE